MHSLAEIGTWRPEICFYYRPSCWASSVGRQGPHGRGVLALLFSFLDLRSARDMAHSSKVRLIAAPRMTPVVHKQQGRSFGEPLFTGHMTQCLSLADDSCGRMPRTSRSSFSLSGRLSTMTFFVMSSAQRRYVISCGFLHHEGILPNLRKLVTLSGTAIRESIRANHSQLKPLFYSVSGRFARITRISDSRESPDSANRANRFARITPLSWSPSVPLYSSIWAIRLEHWQALNLHVVTQGSSNFYT